MPPVRKNALPRGYRPTRTRCAEGHSMRDAYVSFDKRGNPITKCATCHRAKMRERHDKRMQDPILVAAKRAGWEALARAEAEYIAQARAEAAKNTVNG